jgi:hypothetical protein
METFLMVIAIALLVLALILFLELKSTQRRMEDLKGDVDTQIRFGLSAVAEPLGRLPHIEQRMMEIEREVAEVHAAVDAAEENNNAAHTSAAPVAAPAANTTPTHGVR